MYILATWAFNLPNNQVLFCFGPATNEENDKKPDFFLPSLNALRAQMDKLPNNKHLELIDFYI